ncbi:hypothetical protein QR680_011276 [Steinernema hermaphroditum]|uniref:Repressor of RNA polymerase III transcription MAF1 homolog n=1 Tax=Steinernema hermaphroditum TaxID=289476 RepID=A0AA39MC12_9BILA|nr:hypothetical protein QR680_011276 [Steinernema hermaphroditum]
MRSWQTLRVERVVHSILQAVALESKIASAEVTFSRLFSLVSGGAQSLRAVLASCGAPRRLLPPADSDVGGGGDSRVVDIGRDDGAAAKSGRFFDRRFPATSIMKLLESERLESISSFLSQHAINCYLDVRAEAYSCKMCTSDKREWKRSIKSPLEAQQLQPLSPPDYSGWPNGCSPMNTQLRRTRHVSEAAGTASSISDNEGWAYDENGAIMVYDSVSRRTLFDLTNVLTNSYADYDFSGVNSESFTHIESVEIAKAAIDGNFTATVTGYQGIKEDLWNEIDDQIVLHDCVVYSYIPDYKTDPFSEDGCVWSFNYIFVNKNLKRILFMACRSLNNSDIAHDLDVSAEQLWVLEP